MKNILIVDDEIGIRNVLSETLTDEGYVTDTAASAQEARTKMQNVKFNLILLDIWMPGSDKDGLEFLDELIKQGYTIPIVMMSGHGSVDAAAKAMQNGAAAFLEKPITYKKLIDTIARELAKKPSQRIASKAAEEELTRTAAAAVSVHTQSMMGGLLPVFYLKQYNLTLDFNLPYREVIQSVDRAYFETILRFVNYSVSLLAKHAGLERTHLYRKLKAVGVSLPDIREEAQMGMYSKNHRPNIKTKGASVEEVDPIVGRYSLQCPKGEAPGSDIYQARREYVRTHYTEIMNPSISDSGDSDSFDDYFNK